LAFRLYSIPVFFTGNDEQTIDDLQNQLRAQVKKRKDAESEKSKLSAQLQQVTQKLQEAEVGVVLLCPLVFSGPLSLSRLALDEPVTDSSARAKKSSVWRSYMCGGGVWCMCTEISARAIPSEPISSDEARVTQRFVVDIAHCCVGFPCFPSGCLFSVSICRSLHVPCSTVLSCRSENRGRKPQEDQR
jgi:hypothetical protein